MPLTSKGDSEALVVPETDFTIYFATLDGSGYVDHGADILDDDEEENYCEPKKKKENKGLFSIRYSKLTLL